MNQKVSLVSLAVEKAWSNAANATEAKDRYLEMLKTDEALRTEATARYLEKIARWDTVVRPKLDRAMFKRHVLSKGQTSTPNVSRKNTMKMYAKDLFETLRLPETGVKLGQATRQDLDKAISFEKSRAQHHTHQQSFWSSIQKRLKKDDAMVKDVWTPVEIEQTYEEILNK
tara:strand:+ start:2230 stop:2742 length:513 start_codon:yes stop_codon:yes gene_type:complete